MGSVGQNSTFTEHCHVAYQINENQEYSYMVARTPQPPPHPPPTLEMGLNSTFYTLPHFSVEVLCYTFPCLAVCPCSPFPIDNLSIYSRNFFKFCIHIVIGNEWYGIVNGQYLSIFNGVTALFRIGKMVLWPVIPLLFMISE